MVKVQNGKYIFFVVFTMVCVLHWLPFSRGNRSQILLLWWHTVVFHPVDMGVDQNVIFFTYSLCVCVIWGKYVSLIWSYIWQEVRKCSSVSTSFCGQWEHSLSSLESQVSYLLLSLSLSLLLLVLHPRWMFSLSRALGMPVRCWGQPDSLSVLLLTLSWPR